MLRRAVLLSVTALVVLAPACGGDTDRPAETTSTVGDDALPIGSAIDLRGQAAVTVEVSDNVFEPRVIRVDPGTAVTWVNKGFNQHNVTPSDAGSFDPVPTGSLDQGAQATRAFGAAGTYPYYCSIHGTPSRGQRGLVVVGGGGG